MNATQMKFKKAMSRLPSPVTIVTTYGNANEPVGATIGAAVSLSMSPPLLLISVITSSWISKNIAARQRFMLNVVGSEHTELAFRFGMKSDDKFMGVDWDRWNGLPRINGAIIHACCTVRHAIPIGDHTLYASEPSNICMREDGMPVAYADRLMGPIAAA